jgi:hypothetical protein
LNSRGPNGFLLDLAAFYVALSANESATADSCDV